LEAEDFMDEHTSKVIVAILELIGHLIWPMVFLFLIFKFRKYIEALLTRLGSLKIAGSEWVFQQTTDKEVQTKSESIEKIQIGPDGFYSSEGIRKIVIASNLLENDDTVKQELLIFQTPKQRTWLVATKKYLFVLLDDESTQKINALIQTFFEKSKTLPVQFSIHDNAGTVKFDAEDIWWYYSFNLFPTTNSLKNAIKNLIKD